MDNYYNYINETGVIVPDTQDILKDVQNEWRNVFGSQLLLDESTPQGRMIELIATERKNVLGACALKSNSINPNLAVGNDLDAIAGFYGIKRLDDSHTQVYATVQGSKAFTLPAGSEAQDVNGNVYVSSSDIKVEFTETSFIGKGIFVAKESGAIVLAAGELNKVGANAHPDWESVINYGAGTTGWNKQSDEDFRYTIQRTKGLYSTSMIDSLYAALFSINGLKSAFILENFTSQEQTNADNTLIPTGETLLPHSVMIVVQGGNSEGTFDSLVAEAIKNKKSGGCGMSPVVNSDYVKNIIILDKDSLDSPYANRIEVPYTMTFNYAEPVPIYINVAVKNIDYGGDLEAGVKNVLLNWFSGNLSGEDKVVIGKDISAFELSNVLMSNLSVYIKSLTIGTSPSSLSTSEISIPVTKIATLDIDNIVVNNVSNGK